MPDVEAFFVVIAHQHATNHQRLIDPHVARQCALIILRDRRVDFILLWFILLFDENDELFNSTTIWVMWKFRMGTRQINLKWICTRVQVYIRQHASTKQLQHSSIHQNKKSMAYTHWTASGNLNRNLIASNDEHLKQWNVFFVEFIKWRGIFVCCLRTPTTPTNTHFDGFQFRFQQIFNAFWYRQLSFMCTHQITENIMTNFVLNKALVPLLRCMMYVCVLRQSWK